MSFSNSVTFGYLYLCFKSVKVDIDIDKTSFLKIFVKITTYKIDHRYLDANYVSIYTLK